jgi:hypothetical protein
MGPQVVAFGLGCLISIASCSAATAERRATDLAESAAPNNRSATHMKASIALALLLLIVTFAIESVAAESPGQACDRLAGDAVKADQIDSFPSVPPPSRRRRNLLDSSTSNKLQLLLSAISPLC